MRISRYELWFEGTHWNVLETIEINSLWIDQRVRTYKQEHRRKPSDFASPKNQCSGKEESETDICIKNNGSSMYVFIIGKQLKITYSTCPLPRACIWKGINSPVLKPYTLSYVCSCKYCAELLCASWAIVVFLKTASFVVSETQKRPR